MRAYTANMIPGGTTPTVNVSQYDNDYAVTVTLIEGAEIYTPPVGATIRVEGTKPDGHGFEYPCTYQGNVVTMPIYTQMTVVSGRFPIELVVYQSGLRVGSCNIVFAVEKAPLGEDTDISETVIPDIIDAAQSSAEAAQEAAETAQEAAAEVLSSQIVTSASGSVAAFPDGANDVPVKNLVATITPVQSGSGDPSPSNVRAISGRTGMTVTRCGKNILNLDGYVRASSNGLTFTQDATDKNVITVSGTVTASWATISSGAFPCKLVSGRTYTLSVGASGAYRVYVRVRNADGTTPAYTTQTGGTTVTWTQTQDADAITELSFASMTSGTAINTTLRLMVEDGASATDYTPYVGATYPISWQTQAGTIYGGTLNVTTGVLTVDKVLTTFDGTGVTWEKYTPSSGNYCFRTTISDKAVGLTPMYANRYKSLTEPAWGTSDYGVFSGHATLAQVYFRPPNASVAEVTDWNTWLAANNLQVVYPLATPQTYQLTPTEVRTLLGGNTIYTDAGSVTVEYIADTKLYIDGKVAELQALILEN